MDLNALQQLLGAAAGARVACVGDLMLDRYVYGEVSRISPEAPIPVMLHKSAEAMLGAVGNVARNVAALGAHASLVGVIGDDGPGHETMSLMGLEAGLEGDIITQAGRPTTVKTRFVAGGQQLLRLDAEEAGRIDEDAQSRLVRAIEHGAEGAGAILLSDYAKGAVTDAVIAACHRAAARAGARLIVDAKAKSFVKYGEVDLIKPNAAELALLTDLPTETDAEIEIALGAALGGCPAKAVLVTRGAKGMSLAERDKPVRHFRGTPRRVFDVSGAGDTGLAALGLALAAGASIDMAIELAVLASGVAVTKAGTAVVYPAELIDAELAEHLAPVEAKIATLEDARTEVARWRERGLKVGFTNGCFDILHRGHVTYLTQARSWCDRLVVGLNTDASVTRLKGDGRPVNNLESRALVLAGLSPVDLVVPFGEETPIRLIEAVKPDVLVKGADYTVETVVGADLVQSWGGQVKLADIVEGHSTTAALAKLRQTS
jgi:D-beta-D-heptose 7-phosphate kinase / D-beta-D-heptose 1-phosphate adenosyltransferase